MKKSVFRRFIFIYLSFYLCVLIVGMPIYYFSYKKLEESEIRNVSQMVESGSYTMDNVLSSILNIRDLTYNNADYRIINRAGAHTNDSTYSMLVKLQENFTALWNGNDFVSDVGLITDNLVLTRYRNFYGIGLDRFYGNYFSCENYTYEQWRKKIDEKLPLSIFSSENYISKDYGLYQALLFSSTWSGFKAGKSSIFYATLNTDTLRSILVPDEMTDQAFLTIESPNGEILYSYNYNENITYTNVDYITETFNLRVSVGFPNTMISARLMPLKKVFYILISFFIILGIILSLYWAYFSSKPIGKIVTTLDRLQKPHKNYVKQNPYTYISDSLYNVGEQLTNYEQVLKTQSEIIRSNVFERALQSGVLSDEVLTFERSFPKFPKEYQLAMLKLPSNEDLSFDELCQRRYTCFSKLDLIFPKEVYKQMYHDESIILLLPANPNTKYWKEKLMEFHELLSQSLQWNIKIAISDKFNSKSNLPDACSQIRSLLHCVQEKEIVLSMSNYQMRYAFLAIDYGKSQQLFTALEDANLVSVEYIFSDIARIISVSGYIQESAVQKVFDDFREVLIRIQFENPIPLAELHVPTFRMQESYTDNFNNLKEGCIYICKQLQVEQKNKEKDREKEIIRYIKSNISDSMLNAQEVALHFNISDSSLQKIVKEKSGLTFFYFVESQRLDKAVELLQTTTIPINEIYNLCGFASHNSFYKSFKRKYEKSPSQVRSGEQIL